VSGAYHVINSPNDFRIWWDKSPASSSWNWPVGIWGGCFFSRAIDRRCRHGGEIRQAGGYGSAHSPKEPVLTACLWLRWSKDPCHEPGRCPDQDKCIRYRTRMSRNRGERSGDTSWNGGGGRVKVTVRQSIQVMPRSKTKLMMKVVVGQLGMIDVSLCICKSTSGNFPASNISSRIVNQSRKGGFRSSLGGLMPYLLFGKRWCFLEIL
jgi:hypothetical protein